MIELLIYFSKGLTMKKVAYNRQRAVEYAHKWAYERNPKYYNFDNIGGDCTNFISQAIFAGSKVMNYENPGWFYSSLNSRSPSWTGVEFLHDFLVNNKGLGPYAHEIDASNINLGDIIQLKFDEPSFGHSLIVVSAGSPASIDNIKIASHAFNSDNRLLTTYNWSDIRFLHIQGVRK